MMAHVWIDVASIPIVIPNLEKIGNPSSAQVPVQYDGCAGLRGGPTVDSHMARRQGSICEGPSSYTF